MLKFIVQFRRIATLCDKYDKFAFKINSISDKAKNEVARREKRLRRYFY